jgi:hypothetical protein
VSALIDAHPDPAWIIAATTPAEHLPRYTRVCTPVRVDREVDRDAAAALQAAGWDVAVPPPVVFSYQPAALPRIRVEIEPGTVMPVHVWNALAKHAGAEATVEEASEEYSRSRLTSDLRYRARVLDGGFHKQLTAIGG